MKFITFFTFVFLFVSCSQIKLVTPEPSQEGEEDLGLDQGEEVAKVNGVSIREGFLDVLANINARVKAQLSNPVARQKLIENLVDQELLYQESLKRGLDKKKEVAQKTAIYARVIIAQALLEEEIEKKAREYYEEKKDSEFTKVKISQILVKFKKPEDKEKNKKEKKKKGKEPPTEEEKKDALTKAKAIIERLKAGEDFAKVAEEVSDDKASKKKGGDMGAVARDDKRLARRGLDEIAKLAFTLKEGEISEPIESKKGYHIVKVTSKPEVDPFEEAEKIILFQIQKTAKDDLISKLKKDAKIVFPEIKLEPEKPAKVEPKEKKVNEPLAGAPKDTPVKEEEKQPEPKVEEKKTEEVKTEQKETPPEAAPKAEEKQEQEQQQEQQQEQEAGTTDTKDQEQKPKVHFKPGTVKFEEKGAN